MLKDDIWCKINRIFICNGNTTDKWLELVKEHLFNLHTHTHHHHFNNIYIPFQLLSELTCLQGDVSLWSDTFQQKVGNEGHCLYDKGTHLQPSHDAKTDAYIHICIYLIKSYMRCEHFAALLKWLMFYKTQVRYRTKKSATRYFFFYSWEIAYERYILHGHQFSPSHTTHVHHMMKMQTASVYQKVHSLAVRTFDSGIQSLACGMFYPWARHC